MEFLVKKAQKKDLPEIVRVFRAEYGKPPYNEKWTAAGATKKVKQYFSNSKIFAAFNGKELCGFVIYSTFLWYDGERGSIDEICVSESLQGSGIGKSLMAKVENELGKKVVGIDLKTSDKAFAFKFYKSIGFRKNGLVCMTKSLK